MDFEFDFEDVIKDFNSFENFTDYDENFLPKSDD